MERSLRSFFNAARGAYIRFTAGINSPQTTEATKDMTSIFAAAATYGVMAGDPLLAIGGAIGTALGLKSINENGKAFLNTAPGQNG